MWWRDRHPGWWSWAHAPIETQSIMIEAFDEVAGDAAAVEALKAFHTGQVRCHFVSNVDGVQFADLKLNIFVVKIIADCWH